MRAECVLPSRDLAIFVCIYAFCSAAITSGLRSEEFYHDFRMELARQPLLIQVGPVQGQNLRQDSRGLRIALTDKRSQLEPVGVRTQFAVHGDFEILATCDFLSVNNPPKGFGAGARLFARFDSPTKDLFSLSRVAREKEGECFLAYHVHNNKDGKQEQHSKTFPATSANSQLRLVRLGPKLSLQASDKGKEFHELYTADVGTGDVLEIALTATTGGARSGVDVRWNDLRIRADSLPSQISIAVHTASIWWLGALLGVLAIIAVSVAVVGRTWYSSRLR